MRPWLSAAVGVIKVALTLGLVGVLVVLFIVYEVKKDCATHEDAFVCTDYDNK